MSLRPGRSAFKYAFLGDMAEGLLKLSRLPNVVDELWSLTRDGRWHSRKALSRESSFKSPAVYAALRFLVNYGFVQSSGQAGLRVRAVGGPSPKEIARMLSALLFDDKQRVLYS